MFDFLRKKSELEKIIEKNGIDHVTSGFAAVISKKLTSVDIARQFVLEELESASIGNDKAKAYARASGISPQQYKGSLDNSRPEVDGPDGPQQMVIALSLQLASNTDLMVDFRLGILDKIMRKYCFGRYAAPANINASADAGYRLAEIIRHVLKLSDSNLQSIGMNIKPEEANNLVQSCVDDIQNEIFQSYNEKVVAMVVMQTIAMKSLPFKEFKVACMLALSVIWAAKKMKEEGYSLTENERACVSTIESEARSLLKKHHQSVDVITAKLWIAATLTSDSAF